MFAAYFHVDALERQAEVVDPLDSEASGGHDSVGNLSCQLHREGYSSRPTRIPSVPYYPRTWGIRRERARSGGRASECSGSACTCWLCASESLLRSSKGIEPWARSPRWPDGNAVPPRGKPRCAPSGRTHSVWGHVPGAGSPRLYPVALPGQEQDEKMREKMRVRSGRR